MQVVKQKPNTFLWMVRQYAMIVQKRKDMISVRKQEVISIFCVVTFATIASLKDKTIERKKFEMLCKTLVLVNGNV